MSFTAFGRDCEQNGSSSHSDSNEHDNKPIRNKVFFPSGHIQTNGHGQTNGSSPAKPESQTNGHDHSAPAVPSDAQPQHNGNSHNESLSPNGHGNGAPATANPSPRQGSRFVGLTTSLSSGVSIKGTLKFRSELVMDGQVEGTIESLGRLTVGRNGRVRGDIQTRSVTVHGTVDGNLSVGEKCELRSGCTLRGDIETSSLVVDENVNFIGNAEIATRDYLSELRPLNRNASQGS